jgi:SpoVK/Ycf46/Vps4 family AAA+-type ATPase
VDIAELVSRMDECTGADIESLCKKATLSAIGKLRDRTHGAPFVVRRSDFLEILDSDRGTPGPLKGANAPGDASSAHLKKDEGRS